MSPELQKFVEMIKLRNEQRQKHLQEMYVTQEKYDRLAADAEIELKFSPYALAKAFAGGGFRINGCEIKVIGE